MNYQWINAFVGIPYKEHGRTFEATDCYGLVQLVYKNQLGVNLPDWVTGTYEMRDVIRAVTTCVEESVSKGYAEKVDQAQDFDIAVMERYGKAHHVGLVVAGGILHVSKRTGIAVHEKLEDFMRSGAGVPRFYRWHTAH